MDRGNIEGSKCEGGGGEVERGKMERVAYAR